LRKYLIGVAALAIATPAFAQPGPDMDAEEMRRAVPKPHEVEAMGEVAVGAIDALMNVPVGPLREAIEGRPLPPRERNETLGDQMRRDDPNFREHMRDQISLAGLAMGALAEQMAVMAPILRRTLEDVEQRMEDAARGTPRPDHPEADYRDEVRPGEPD
jgi:hypothetical protein